jgi:hypothetical protein
MPKYRLHADHFLDGNRCRAGDVVDFHGNPGSQMEPLDDDARRRFQAMLDERKSQRKAPLTRFPFQRIEAKVTGGPERKPMDRTIPEDWRNLKGLQLTNLAKKLGAPFGVNAHNARAFIEDLEHRQNRAIAPPQPPGDDPNQALAAVGD